MKLNTLTALTKFSCSLAAVFALGAISQANPLPPITGSIGFNGTAQLNGTLGSATSITKITNASVAAGTQDENGGVSYAAVPDDYKPVTFTTPITGWGAVNVSETLGTPTTLWTFVIGTTTYSFTATTIELVNQSTDFLNISGTGYANITGDAQTDGDWSLTIVNATNNLTATKFGFSADTAIPAVPDTGMTALLIGLGMGGIGLGLIARRRSFSRS